MESIVAQRIPYSQIRVMFDAANTLEKQGKRIIHLEIGRPDFDTPEHIVEAAVEALRSGKHHYSPNAGILELRQAISDKFISEYGLEYDPETEVVVTNGVAEGIYVTIHALLNAGDQILIPDPRWINYDVDAITNFVDPVDYTLFGDKSFQPVPEEMEEKITRRTRMILVASPSNPTGSVAGRDVLEKICRTYQHRDFSGNEGENHSTQRLLQIFLDDRMEVGLCPRAERACQSHTPVSSVHDHFHQYICPVGGGDCFERGPGTFSPDGQRIPGAQRLYG